MELIKLKKIDSLRKQWPKEDRDFTPWLSENLQEIGDVIGYELELEETEKAVGPYFADIVAKDINDNRRIVIENQYDKSNHDHLGKCITYSSVLNAKCVVWIAEKFCDEHKKALEWLNDNTTQELEFYGIELSLLMIDDKHATLDWSIAVAPNEIVRIGSIDNSKGVSPTGLKQQKFWQSFRNAISDYIKHPQKADPKYWFDIPIGKAGIGISNTYNTNTNTIGCRIYINSSIADYMLPYLEGRKEQIEKELGFNLVWNPNPNNKDKVIWYQKVFDMDDNNEYTEAVKWLKKTTISMHRVFSKIVKEYK